VSLLRSWWSDSQEILHFLWSPEVHCRVHKNPLLDPILKRLNSEPQPHSLFKIHFNIIIPSMPGSLESVSFLQLFQLQFCMLFSLDGTIFHLSWADRPLAKKLLCPANVEVVTLNRYEPSYYQIYFVYFKNITITFQLLVGLLYFLVAPSSYQRMFSTSQTFAYRFLCLLHHRPTLVTSC
jgi:hypothetical protein